VVFIADGISWGQEDLRYGYQDARSKLFTNDIISLRSSFFSEDAFLRDEGDMVAPNVELSSGKLWPIKNKNSDIQVLLSE